ncbi:MAG: hypothetical protein J6C85_05990 [Alphaproteobacteria bacterium]|nr:hypothetical protein [Alphaproteobacteria bacterium]
MKKSKKTSNSYFWVSCCLFAGVGLTVAALLHLPIALTNDTVSIGLYIPCAVLGLLLYLLGTLYADDYLLKEYAKGGGVVILLGAVAMVVNSVLFSIMGRDLSGSDFVFAEWVSFIVSSITVAVLHCRKV